MSSHTVWIDPAIRPAMSVPSTAEVVVVGGGIAGVSAALRLGRVGKDTVLVTTGRLGGGVTGRSNAKVTALHQVVYDDLSSRHGDDVAAAYASANSEAVDWLREVAGPLVWQPRDAVTLARTNAERSTLTDETAAARRAGLEVSDRPSDDWPGTHQALRLGGQGQVDPVALIDRMAALLAEAGVTVVEDRRATKVTPSLRGQVVSLGDTSIAARHVVVATGMPVLDRGAYFALCEPESSYLVAISHPGVGGDMMITAGEPKISIRWVEGDTPEDRIVLIGGQGHRTGAGGSTKARYAALEDWARANLTGLGDTVSAWSAMDFMSPDRLPFAGPLNRVGDGLLVITGMSKWGFSLGAACAATIERIITGEAATPFDRAVHTRRIPDLKGLGSVTKATAEVARHMTTGWASAMTSSLPDTLIEGQGAVGRKGLKPVAACRVEGDRHEQSAICPHLGGIVTWNDGDQTWDCPLHGSRFEADGDVRHGPANRELGRS